MNAGQYIPIFLVRLYRWTLSPAKTLLFGPLGRCRYTPSCSNYALEAFHIHGALRGGRLSLQRICRCHPWGGWGEDPVPLPTKNSNCRAVVLNRHQRHLPLGDRRPTSDSKFKTVFHGS